MKKLSLFLALFILLSSLSPVYAEGLGLENDTKQEEVRQEIDLTEDPKTEEIKEEDQEATRLEESEEDKNLDSLKLELSELENIPVQLSPDQVKPFTVTKKPLAGGEESLVGDYDTFFDAIGACKQDDLSNEYIVTVNKDYTIPSSEAMHSRMSVNIFIKSAQEKQYTLKRKGERDFFSIHRNCKIRTENIIFDGNSEIEFTGIFENGNLTLGSGTVVQNFADSSAYDGPAIYVSGGTLNIKEGAILRNNSSNTSGGIIQVRQNSTLNIEGGLFENNSTTRDGGVIAAYGELNITGGLFKNNKADKTSGAIIIGSKAKANIENAVFENNQASTGGAIYSSNDFTLSKSNFTGNKAKWGGAIFAAKNLDIKDTNFENNEASVSGGAIYSSNGLTINNSKFINNQAEKQGGAIFVTPYEYKDPISNKHAYTKLKTDETTLFSKNKSGGGLFIPPSNFEDFTDLKFSDKSDVDHGILTRKSLLNNYDVNYKNEHRLIVYDANGGEFSDGSTKKQETHSVDDIITIMKAAQRQGYKFLAWTEPQHQPGDSYTVKDHHTFYAQWEKIEDKKPDPKPEVKPKNEGRSYSYSLRIWDDDEKIQDHIKYIYGYPDGNFLTEGKITRAEAVAIIARLEKYPLDDKSKTVFSDGLEDQWYNSYINACYKKGILKEKSGQEFRPNEPITRAELADIVSRITKKNEAKSDFIDIKGHWAESAINQGYGNGIIAGYPDKTFKPDQNLTRSEAVKIFNKIYNRYPDKKYINENINSLIKFKDLKKDHWAYYEIMEAAQSHKYVRLDNNMESWKSLLK